MGLSEYFENMNHMNFKVPKYCSICKRKGTLIKHGYYSRNCVTDDSDFRILIPRLYCKHCRHTMSYLPNFCVPHFQYTAKFIISALKSIFTGTSKKIKEGLKSLFRFYRRRFIENLPLSEIFLRNNGIKIVLPENKKERAIKVYESLLSYHREETLFQEFLYQLDKHFMAN